jgi:TolB-like protein/tetratricopeptide (TPR) repeat protein
MSFFRKLIHEMHRRSLWQVLGIYVVASWVALQVVDVLVDNFRLPDWFPALALGLLVVGLPVVLATAFIQEGTGGRGVEGPGAEARPSRDNAPPARARQGGEGDRLVRLLTWRNAILGGLAALALWGVVAAAWILLGVTGGRAGGVPAGADPASDPIIESIAVLPFADMSPEDDQEYFADGTAEEILDALARVPGLKVAARSSSFQFKGRAPDVRAVGDTLGVEAVLEGSVRKSGDRLRITVQLVSAEDGFQRWSETYDVPEEDIFAVQREIAGAVVQALGMGVEGDGAPRFADPPAGVAAHDLYLQGLSRWHVRSTEEDVRAALSHFEQATGADPLYGRAYGGAALAYAVLAQWSDMPPARSSTLARRAAARARELDPTLIEPDLALCQTATWNDWAWDEAEPACRRATELNPNSGVARVWYTELLALTGRLDQAHVQNEHARELSPLSPRSHSAHGWIHSQMGDYDSVTVIQRRVLRAAPRDEFADRHIMVALFATARPENRQELTETVLRRAETAEDSSSYRAFVDAFLGAAADPQRRAAALELVPPLAFDRVVIPIVLARLQAREPTLRLLERMLERHDVFLPEVLRHPVLAWLRDEPRFSDVWRAVFRTDPPARP